MFLISSYDLRESGDGQHWSEESVIQSRAYFNNQNSPPSLQIARVTPADQAMYRCRVDFERGPSTSHNINLTVIGKFSFLFHLLS